LVAPSAIAARIKARFDRLLLPGNASRASMARPNGLTRAAATPLSVDHGVSASSKLSSLIGRAPHNDEKISVGGHPSQSSRQSRPARGSFFGRAER